MALCLQLSELSFACVMLIPKLVTGVVETLACHVYRRSQERIREEPGGLVSEDTSGPTCMDYVFRRHPPFPTTTVPVDHDYHDIGLARFVRWVGNGTNHTTVVGNPVDVPQYIVTTLHSPWSPWRVIWYLRANHTALRINSNICSHWASNLATPSSPGIQLPNPACYYSPPSRSWFGVRWPTVITGRASQSNWHHQSLMVLQLSRFPCDSLAWSKSTVETGRVEQDYPCRSVEVLENFPPIGRYALWTVCTSRPANPKQRRER